MTEDSGKEVVDGGEEWHGPSLEAMLSDIRGEGWRVANHEDLVNHQGGLETRWRFEKMDVGVMEGRAGSDIIAVAQAYLGIFENKPPTTAEGAPKHLRRLDVL